MKKVFYYYKKYLKLAWKYKWLWMGGMFFAILLLFINNYTIFLLGDLTNAIASGGDILKPITLIGGVLSFNIVFEPITFFLKSKLYNYIVRDLFKKVYQHVIDLDHSFHVSIETGRVISKILNIDTTIAVYQWNLEWWSFESICALIIPMILIFFISWKIGLMILISMLIVIPFQSIPITYNIKKRTLLKEVEYDRNTAVIDGITNHETINLFGSQNREKSLVSKLLDRWVGYAQRYQNTFRVIDLFARVGGIFVFFIGGISTYFLYDQGELGIAAVVVIIAYIMRFSGNLMGAIFSMREIFKNVPIIEDVYNLLEEKKLLEYPERSKKFNDSDPIIKLNNVNFSYREKSDVISHINLEINKGETVAFVGPSGGGKTTLVRLILRYFDPNSGQIIIGGNDIKKYTKENINAFFGVVPQEPILFNRSVKYNIGYAVSEGFDIPKQYEEKVFDAAMKAQIHDFIMSLPEGYDTIVGERGIKLSGGQKQRVAIARVLLKNPKIIIFDEATSMLDSESEQLIQKAFKELSKNATTIIIAHRLSTIRHADRIIVIDKGKVMEEGNHEQLIAKDGEYAKLWKIQSGGFVKSV